VPPAAPALPVESVKSIRLRFGRMGCESTTRCFVDIKTTGPVERLGGGLALRVRRGGRNPVDRFVMAQRVRKGLWRAWTNLPWGTVRLTAMGADAEGNVVTRPVRQTITVEAG